MPTSSNISFVVGSTIRDPGTPEEVTKAMGTEPTEIYRSELQSRDGDTDKFVKHKTWLWLLHSPLNDTHPPSRRLGALIQTLLPLKENIRAVPARYWKHVQCKDDSTPRDFLILNDWGLIVSPEDVSRLADLGLGLSFNTRVWQPEAYRINIEKAEPVDSPKGLSAPG